jgi:DNA-binding NarL/FixJ family response regulator
LQEFRAFTVATGASPVRVGNVQLTPRESEILRMLGSGLTTIEVADMLSLSPVTVRRHISAGVAKLGVADRDAAIRAIEPLAAAG